MSARSQDANNHLEPFEWMDSKRYVSERLEDQIAWYDRKSKANKRGYLSLRLIEAILAVFIPFLAGFDQHPSVLFAIGVIGIVVSICAAVTALLQLQERWIEYRTTAESLKKEKYHFLTRTEPYGENDSFQLLVQRVETLVSKENTNWAQYMMKPRMEESHGK